MRNVLIISFSPVSKDPRVRRQIEYYSKNNKVSVIGFSNPNINGINFYEIEQERKNWIWYFKLLFLLFRLYGLYNVFKKEYQQVKSLKNQIPYPEIIIANDHDTLKSALIFHSKKSVLIFDAHEYSPEENTDSLKWRILLQGFNIHNIKKHAKKAELMTTVCQSISKKYFDEFQLKSSLILNAPFQNISTIHVSNDDSIKILHHGLALESRHIENMIFMCDFLDSRFTLDLMLVPNKLDYYESLIKLCESRKNVRIIEPVNFEQIIPFSTYYDIGLFLLEPSNFNYKYALPNKFFEYIASNLTLAIGPSEEMVKIVKKYELGVLAKSFKPEDLALELNNLTKEKIYYHKMKCNSAFEELSSYNGFKDMDKKIENYLK